MDNNHWIWRLYDLDLILGAFPFLGPPLHCSAETILGHEDNTTALTSENIPKLPTAHLKVQATSVSRLHYRVAYLLVLLYLWLPLASVH